MNHHGGHHQYGQSPLPIDTSGAVDLSRIGGTPPREMPLRELQKLALEEMEKCDVRAARMNRVRVGDFYWIPDAQNSLHLGCDTVDVNVVKLLGMPEVERRRAEAVRAEKEE